MARKELEKGRLGSTTANGCHRSRTMAPHDVWCWDFMFDRTVSCSQLKWLSVVGEYTRKCVALKVDRCRTSEDVFDTFFELTAMRGVPEHIRSEAGPSSSLSSGVAGSSWWALAGFRTSPGALWRMALSRRKFPRAVPGQVPGDGDHRGCPGCPVAHYFMKE